LEHLIILLFYQSKATQLFRFLDKYRPESKKAKRDRLKKQAEAKASGKDATPSKRPPVVRSGITTKLTIENLTLLLMFD